MRPSIGLTCRQCHTYHQILVADHQVLSCPQCQNREGEVKNLNQVFDFCPLCQGRQFYIQKDFNQALGCLIMLIGILLVPKTFGLSLPLFAGIDWWLHKKVATMVICYKCLSEFRGFPIPEHFKTFMHHIGERYDNRRSVSRREKDA